MSVVFRRSSSGLANMYLFLKCHAVIFVEGGSPRSFLEIASGQANNTSIDCTFWSKMFHSYFPRRQFAVLAVGSKSTLLDIATEVLAGRVKNVCIGMDRDFDNHRNTMLSHKAIFYSCGYSWENDVWRPKVVESIFSSIALLPANTDYSREIALLFDRFFFTMKSMIRVEVAWSPTFASLIPEGCGRLINKSEASVNRSFAAELLKQARANGYRHSKLNVVPENDCKSHLISIFAKAVLEKMYREKSASSKYSFSSDMANCLAIDNFVRLEKSGQIPEAKAYYHAQFERIKKGFFATKSRN